MLDLDDLHVYIDGSSREGPRRGGIGIKFVFLEGEEIKEEIFPYRGFLVANSQQMELKACITAFEKILKFPEIERFKKITIFSDSRYVVDNGGNAVFTWYANGWRKAEGGLVANADIWKEWRRLRIKLSKTLRARIDIVYKPRRSNEHMRAVDNLAKTSSKKAEGRPFRAITVRRNKYPVKLGHVNFTGQKLSILVVTEERQKVQGMNRYSLQVITKNHPDYRRKDNVDSPDIIGAGHRYLASFAQIEGDPGIHRIKIHKEYQLKRDKIVS